MSAGDKRLRWKCIICSKVHERRIRGSVCHDCKQLYAHLTAVHGPDWATRLDFRQSADHLARIKAHTERVQSELERLVHPSERRNNGRRRSDGDTE